MKRAALLEVALDERLAFQNVVSSRATFHSSEMAARIEGFTSMISAKGYELKGPLFYSLNNVPKNEMLDIELFAPVRQNVVTVEEGLRFHSYFQISPVARGFLRSDFAKQTERVYRQLLSTLEANDLEINAPFFHVVQRDVSPYVLICVGYADPSIKS